MDGWAWGWGWGSARAVAGYMVNVFYFCRSPARGGGFGFARAFDFLLPSLPQVRVCWRFLFLLQSLPRVICAILFFIFIDPCAGRHLLSLLRPRQRKQRKALHTTPA
jgi:hypothetical protein